VRTVFFVSLLLALPASAQKVQVSLSPNQPTVGDRVEAVIALQVDPAVAGALAAEPRFPIWGRTWGEADILATSEPRKTVEAGGSVVYRQRLTLAAFRPGKVPLPPAAIAVPLRSGTIQAATPAGLSLDLRSVLPQDAKTTLSPKAPKPPVPLPIGDAFWWTLAGMLAACLALGLLILRQRRTATAAEAPRPDLAPFPELAAAIDRLAAEPSAVRLHTGLSLAFRHYLARVLGFGAEEHTTTEIQRHLLAGRLPAALVRQSVDLLRACDLVKFARQEVDPERSRERLDAARRIGMEIDERIRPAAAAEGLEATG
jgi:hypothetical protein